MQNNFLRQVYPQVDLRAPSWARSATNSDMLSTPRSRTRDNTLPIYTGRTDNAALAVDFARLHVDVAPVYQACPNYETASRPCQPLRQQSSGVAATVNKSNGCVKPLAQLSANAYFRQVAKRSRKLSVASVVEQYKHEMQCSKTHAAINGHSHSANTIVHRHRCKESKLRSWVNQAIECVVLPEIERRAKEDVLVWRSEQRHYRDCSKADSLEKAYNARLAEIAYKDAEHSRIFGDLGQGYKTAGTEVSELGKQGTEAARLRARRISVLLKGREDDMIWTFRHIQDQCLKRMQQAWRALLEHCTIQIQLVIQRGEAARYSPGKPELHASVMRALMAFEAEQMQHALIALLETFQRSCEYKCEEFPPLASFFKVFAPLTGSALRAAREVTTSQGILYDNKFLQQNRLDDYANAFYAAMKEHLTCLMISDELKSFTWQTERQRIRRASAVGRS